MALDQCSCKTDDGKILSLWDIDKRLVQPGECTIATIANLAKALSLDWFLVVLSRVILVVQIWTFSMCKKCHGGIDR